MTTVDIDIYSESRQERWHLGNGLSGPASKLGVAMWDEWQAGRAEAISPPNVAEFCMRISGANLAAVMGRLDLTGWLYSGSADPASILAALVPSATYRVALIEF